MRCIVAMMCASMLLAIGASCGGGGSQSHEEHGDTVRFAHASLLTVVRHKDYVDVTVANPWRSGHALHRYLLVPRSSELPHPLPHGTVVRVPLSRAIAFSTVHASLMMELGMGHAMVGMADVQYAKSPLLRQRCESGRVVDVGSSLSPSIERIMELSPDAMLVSPFENSAGYGRVEELGVPLIECADYMESSPLGRAEWMRFYGMLLGCEHTADSLYAVVDSCYKVLCNKALAMGQGRSVLMDRMTGSVWYVPGGSSTIGTMLADAVASYPYAKSREAGSLPLAFEKVLSDAANCDVWLMRYSSDHVLTYAELLSEHPGYSRFKPFAERQCYGCNVQTSPFYEETPWHPDWLLSDFISIAHPHADSIMSLRYFHPLSLSTPNP